jgi:hypothetical protein
MDGTMAAVARRESAPADCLIAKFAGDSVADRSNGHIAEFTVSKRKAGRSPAFRFAITDYCASANWPLRQC